MTNAHDPSREDEHDQRYSPTSDFTPPSAYLVSPLSLARALVEALRQRDRGQGDAWRIARALSLDIVDLLESTRTADASGDEADTDHPTTGFDAFSR